MPSYARMCSEGQEEKVFYMTRLTQISKKSGKLII